MTEYDKDLNGDLSDFPPGMFKFFTDPSSRSIVTDKWIREVTGSPVINVQMHDIYVVGKRKSNRSPVFWTKMQITSRESKRNVFQGILSVRFTGGYGLKKSKEGSSIQMMRPINIREVVTEDICDIKRRAAIHLKDGHYVMLCDAEPFCHIPFINDQIPVSESNKIKSNKRKYYANKKDKDEQWPHITRQSVLKGNKRKLLKMIQPYRKNVSIDKFFAEFRLDIESILESMRDDSGIPVTSCKINTLHKVTENPIQKKVLSEIPMDSIDW